jgi:putative ABC transport system ATP-binding protein
MITPPVVTENLSKSYPMGRGQVHALRGVSLRLEAGEFVALMGASGSGKSTLLHLLGCLDTPTSGRYWLTGRDAAALSGNARALLRNQTIGFIFQNFNLLPRLSALENVALPLSTGGSQVLARSPHAGSATGAAQRHQPNELQAANASAQSPASRQFPTLLLADEPTGNLTA